VFYGYYETLYYSTDLNPSLCKVAKSALSGLTIIYFINKANNGTDAEGFIIAVFYYNFLKEKLFLINYYSPIV